MADQAKHVLFLCTGNSARSIIGEVVMNALSNGRFTAYSAGSHPSGRINPLTLELLQKNRLPTDNLRSKSWDEFALPNAPKLDFVFTVCDDAAGEVCPIWPGQPITAHWGVEDPAAVAGTEDEKRKAFLRAFTTLRRRIELFLSLSHHQLDRLALTQQVNAIGSS